jgi:hypothetical protein
MNDLEKLKKFASKAKDAVEAGGDSRECIIPIVAALGEIVIILEKMNDKKLNDDTETN